MEISLLDLFLLFLFTISTFLKSVGERSEKSRFRYIQMPIIISFILALVLYAINRFVYNGVIPIVELYYKISLVIHMLISYVFANYLFFYILPLLLIGPFGVIGLQVEKIQKKKRFCIIVILLYVIMSHIGYIAAVFFHLLKIILVK